jgi:hypothetical protein
LCTNISNHGKIRQQWLDAQGAIEVETDQLPQFFFKQGNKRLIIISICSVAESCSHN